MGFHVQRAVSFPHSDVLVFLTGQEEIESMQRILERCRTVMPSSCLDLQVCTLFAALPTEQQKAVFTWTKKVWTAMHCVKGEVYCMCAYCPVTCCCSSAYQCTLLTCIVIIITSREGRLRRPPLHRRPTQVLLMPVLLMQSTSKPGY